MVTHSDYPSSPGSVTQVRECTARLIDVANPSTLFFESMKSGVKGSAVSVCMEGTRPLLVEIQSLVGKSTLATPHRTVTGLDPNRFSILLAVLERRAGLAMSLLDFYAKVAGELKLTEPAGHLALAASVLSSVIKRPWQGRVAFFEEVGLAGEIRATTNPVGRVQEAMKLGFDRVHLPKRNFHLERQTLTELTHTSAGSNIQLYPIEHGSRKKRQKLHFKFQSYCLTLKT